MGCWLCFVCVVLLPMKGLDWPAILVCFREFHAWAWVRSCFMLTDWRGTRRTRTRCALFVHTYSTKCSSVLPKTIQFTELLLCWQVEISVVCACIKPAKAAFSVSLVLASCVDVAAWLTFGYSSLHRRCMLQAPLCWSLPNQNPMNEANQECSPPLIWAQVTH